jgi:hypothetical protein
MRANRGHACYGPVVNVIADSFFMTEYFFEERCLGLTDEDFKNILTVCDTCLRVHLSKHTDWHKCPDDAGDHDFTDNHE